MRSRTRRAAALLIASGVALGTSACGGFPDIPAKKYAAPATETPVDTQWRHRVADPVVEAASFTGEPLAVFGSAAVEAGYAETVEFAADTTFDEMLLVPSDFRGKQQFLTQVSRMTRQMAGEYNATLDAAWEGDQDAVETVFAYRFFFDDDPDYRVQDTGPLVLDHVIEDPQISVERGLGRDQLEVSFIQRGDVRMQEGGEAVLVRYTKTASYWLDPAPPGDAYRWRIDGIDIVWKSGEPVPDTGTY